VICVAPCGSRTIDVPATSGHRSRVARMRASAIIPTKAFLLRLDSILAYMCGLSSAETLTSDLPKSHPGSADAVMIALGLDEPDEYRSECQPVFPLDPIRLCEQGVLGQRSRCSMLRFAINHRSAPAVSHRLDVFAPSFSAWIAASGLCRVLSSLCAPCRACSICCLGIRECVRNVS